MLAEFVRRGWLEEEAAAAMLAWPHSGSGACLGPVIHDREALLRVALYPARAPVAEGRLRYDAEPAEVELVSDRTDGPYAGVHRRMALEFIARWMDHVPERCRRAAGLRWRRPAAARRPWIEGNRLDLGLLIFRTKGPPPGQFFRTIPPL